MDIEEFLKHKRSLETKKEILEAKKKLKEEKERRGHEPPQQEPVRREYARRERDDYDDRQDYDKDYRRPRRYRDVEPRPWMAWNLILLFIVIALFSLTYFFPRYNEQDITAYIDAKVEEGVQTIDVDTAPPTTAADSTTTTTLLNTTDDTAIPLPGPEFEFSVEDTTLGPFDAKGKMNGEILVVEDADQYSDILLKILNNEPVRTKCYIDRTIDIDEDFDGTIDITEIDLDHMVVELSGGSKKEIADAVPGEVKNGDYNGVGSINVEYESRCFFCIDKDCNTIQQEAKETKSAMLQVRINPSLLNNA